MKTKEELKTMSREALEAYADMMQSAADMKNYYYEKIRKMEKLISAMQFILESNKDFIK